MAGRGGSGTSRATRYRLLNSNYDFTLNPEGNRFDYNLSLSQEETPNQPNADQNQQDQPIYTGTICPTNMSYQNHSVISAESNPSQDSNRDNNSPISERRELDDSSIDSESENDNPISSGSEEDNDSYRIDNDYSSDDSVSNNEEFVSNLTSWAVHSQVPQKTVSYLLKVLHKHDCFKNLPVDARTLMGTPKGAGLQLLDMPPGKYYRYGIAKGIKRVLTTTTECPDNIEILINMDGIPLTKSSNSQFWPILGKLPQVPNSSPFCIGVYHGFSKPESSAIYLQYFVEEARVLIEHGLVIRGEKRHVTFKGFICDAPARSFVKGIKGHGGYCGCEKCLVYGEYFDRRVVFVDVTAPLRTDDDFRERKQREHHLTDSPLEAIGIGMVSTFPYEYMHLACLGVMRKTIRIFVKGKLSLRWGRRQIDECSSALLSLSPFFCSEFARKPRSLKEIDRWKATEWRQMLLYTGIVVLRRHLAPDFYKHFLSFHVAMTILVSPSLRHLFEYAEKLLHYYVTVFKDLYGRENMSYNVHGLLHLAKDAMRFGSLDQFSAFPFENHLQGIKKRVRKAHQPLEQLINRLAEEERHTTYYQHSSW